ncbi:hypothetical protein PR003_g9040 [Phytophthora rubi]|uniref:RxLR effector protein n=1 Tax=Phytophthora rubi TaxID=129364 RepID=A0A6A4FHE5_9STRA|nr:hypothetical protein PR002_g9003 [Phytophthora rubi]KAE9037200.1 hypothetical protein PR001_g8473 [Phytophthora rubi]KAE9343324.1 hypothetical protein PR003_g9040 [Phytophthora rubi]
MSRMTLRRQLHFALPSVLLMLWLQARQAQMIYIPALGGKRSQTRQLRSAQDK